MVFIKKKFLSLPPLAAFVNSVVLEFHYKLGLNSSVYQNLTCEVFESGLQVVCGALLTNKMLVLLVTCLLMIRRGEWEMLIFCISLPAKEKNTEIVCFLPEWMNECWVCFVFKKVFMCLLQLQMLIWKTCCTTEEHSVFIVGSLILHMFPLFFHL